MQFTFVLRGGRRLAAPLALLVWRRWHSHHRTTAERHLSVEHLLFSTNGRIQL